MRAKAKVVSMILAIILIIGTVPAGAASAVTGQEMIVKQQVAIGYFDIWQHVNGKWQDTNQDGVPDALGDTGKNYQDTFGASEFLDRYDLTRVEVQWPFGPDEYNNTPAGAAPDFVKANPDIPWEGIKSDYLTHLPDNLSVWKSSEDLSQGKVTVGWTLDISPWNTALDLTDANVRAQLGLDQRQFEKLAHGYRWYLPVLITWYGVPKKPAPDMYVKALDPGTSEVIPGNAYNGTVVFGLAADYKTPVQGTLTLTNNGYPVPGVDGQTVTFNPGEEKSFNFTYHGDAGGCKLVAKIHPVDPPADRDWSNNTKEVYVPAKEMPKPGPGGLTFQAYSQEGQDVYGNTVPSMPREPNTAKWTDTVKATLRPPAPVPPRGTLDWWKITSAKLTYPKKHPEFTFGHPLEPVGTITIDMTPNGHEATAEFREDWSLNGAPIYDVLEDRMVPGPTEYTITAEYTIEYQYHYTECDETGCWTVTETATTSGSASGQLSVNGTGVNSL